ncbi:potassium-transporting ATPase subunit KdpA, partial [Escherichia sp. S69_ASV_4]|nr:potassium-transporting ATPase subunit KdpA [Escherichia sp. S69_ASV_4]
RDLHVYSRRQRQMCIRDRFVGLLIGTVLLVGALTFIPALALGPVAEYLS